MLTAINPSPLFYNQLDSFPKKQQPILIYPQPIILNDLSYYEGRKRKSKPSRSIQQVTTVEEKYIQGVVKLDVYTQYLKNPSTLLDMPIKEDEVERREKIVASPKKPKPLDTDLPKLDLSSYRNTRNAPSVIWKKG